MTNEHAREVDIPLAFLSGSATAKLYEDGANAAKEPTELAMSTRSVGPNDVLRVKLAPAGGFAAIFDLAE
jgi:alpha-glucosidase